MRTLLAAALIAASPALGGVEEAVEEVILPGLAAFSAASAALSEAAAADCTPGALAAPHGAAMQAWMAVGDFRIGPTETEAPHIAFWPDPRGFTRKTLAALLADAGPAIDDPAAFAEVSVAGKGLFALEMLIHDRALSDYEPQGPGCRLARAVAADLAAVAGRLEAAWRRDFAQTLTTAGAPGNATYMTGDEAMRALYTQALSSLEFTADKRLGEPMGSFEKPRPKRAEAWRSGRSLPNALAATEAAVALARALAGGALPATEAALAEVRAAAGQIVDPSFQDLEDPAARFRVELLQQRIEALGGAIEAELGLALGLTPGFNAGDGD